MTRRELLAAGLALAAWHPACTTVGRSRSPSHAGLDRLGASTASVAGYSLLEAIEQLRRLGFSTIEMIAYTGARHSVGDIPGFDYYEASEAEREEVFLATRAFRHISAHMPFQDVNLLTADADTRLRGIETITRAMDGLAFLEGSMAVVHPGWPDRGQRFRDIWGQMIDTFRYLGDYAAERGMRVGLETMQPNSVRDYTELIFDIDHPSVGATIDTGHIRGAHDIGLPEEQRDTDEARERFNDVLDDVIRRLRDKAYHFHLTDVEPREWVDHREIGTGIIDFRRVFDTLRDIGYQGLLVFELEEPNALASLAASKARVETLMQAFPPSDG